MMDDYKELLQNRMDDIFEHQNGTEEDLAIRSYIEHLYRQVIRCDYDCKHLYRWELGKDVISILTSNIVKPDKSIPATLFGIEVRINYHSPRVIRLWRLMNYDG